MLFHCLLLLSRALTSSGGSCFMKPGVSFWNHIYTYPLSLSLSLNFYRPQRSCEGYVFTGVCLSTWGVSASVHAGIPQPPGSRHPPEQTPPRSRHPQRDGHCCGRYASYWNAFLLIHLIRRKSLHFEQNESLRCYSS